MKLVHDTAAKPHLVMETAHPDHAYALAPHLREADKLEFSHTFSDDYSTVESILVRAIEGSSPNGSQVFTICDDSGHLHGLWGHSSWRTPTAVTPYGAVWLCSDDQLFSRWGREMTRIARRSVFPGLDLGYESYGNLVHAANTVHVKWLRNARFKIISTVERKGAPFFFMMRSEAPTSDITPVY